MQKTIFLNVEYLDIKKVKKSEISELRKNLFDQAVNTFKKGMHEFLVDKSLKIIRQDFPLPEIVIEYDDNNKKIYSKLIELDVVNVIDFMVYDYTEKQDPQAKDNHIDELKDKMSKYLK